MLSEQSDSLQSDTYNGWCSWIKFHAGSALLLFQIFTELCLNRTRCWRERETRTKRSNDYARIVSWNDRFSGDTNRFCSTPSRSICTHHGILHTLIIVNIENCNYSNICGTAVNETRTSNHTKTSLSNCSIIIPVKNHKAVFSTFSFLPRGRIVSLREFLRNFQSLYSSLAFTTTGTFYTNL